MKKYIITLFLIGQCLVAQHKVPTKEQKKQKDSTKVALLEEVFVTANRTASLRRETPVAISKLNEKLIDETKAVAAFEIVNKTPGVLMVNLGNEQHSMSIRQPMTTNAYYLFLEDGLPIRPLGIFNHNALLEINQFNLQTIEVVKGPASSLYGPEAVGGTINLISQKPHLNPEFKFGVQADQWGYKRFQASGGATIGKIGFHIAGISSIQENSWMAFSDYDKDNINLRIDYNIGPKTKLINTTMWGKYFSETSSKLYEEGFYNKSYTSTSSFTYRKSDAVRTKLAIEHQWNDNASTTGTIYYRDNKLGQNPSYSIRWSPAKTTATGEVNSNNFKSYGALAQHNQKLPFLNAKMIIGALYDYSPVTYWAYRTDLRANLNFDGKTVNTYDVIAERPDIKLANYNADIYNTGIYKQYSLKPFDFMTLTSGLRYDQMKVNYNNTLGNATGTKVYEQFTSKAGINLNPTKNLGFYANYAQGFAPPALTSIFRTKPGTGGTTGNPAEFYYNLKSATFDNYEFGGFVTLFKNKLSFDYALYYMEGKNELLNIRQSNNTTDYQSAGETLHKGVEFGLHYKPSSQLSFRLGGTISEHRYVDFVISDAETDDIKNLSGYEMPQAPRWSGNSELNYYPNWLPKLRMALEWQTVGNYYQDQINTIKYVGYNIFNLRAGYQCKTIEIYANVFNATDKLYATNVSRGNQINSFAEYTAAAPRTILIGLQYNFSLKK